MTPIAKMTISSKQRRSVCCGLTVTSICQHLLKVFALKWNVKTTQLVFHLFKLEVNFQLYNQVKVKAKVTDGIRGKINH